MARITLTQNVAQENDRVADELVRAAAQKRDRERALAEGKVVFQGTSDEALSDPVLLDAYLGAKADA